MILFANSTAFHFQSKYMSPSLSLTGDGRCKITLLHAGFWNKPALQELAINYKKHHKSWQQTGDDVGAATLGVIAWSSVSGAKRNRRGKKPIDTVSKSGVNSSFLPTPTGAGSQTCCGMNTGQHNASLFLSDFVLSVGSGSAL